MRDLAVPYGAQSRVDYLAALFSLPRLNHTGRILVVTDYTTNECVRVLGPNWYLVFMTATAGVLALHKNMSDD